MEPLIGADEASRRARAAIGYAGLQEQEIVEKSGISSATLRRIVSVSSPRGFHKAEEMWALADACGVPRAFLEEGWQRYEDELSLREEFEGLRDSVNLIQRQLVGLVGSRTTAPESEAPPGTPGTGDPR